MGKTILGLLAVAAAVLIYASFKPDTSEVKVTMEMRAPAEKIFANLDDFQRWKEWVPYQSDDPNIRASLSGSPQGVGAVCEWDGQRMIGAGRIEITNSSPPTSITYALDLSRPVENHSTLEFNLAVHGEYTFVTWTIRGPVTYASKVKSIFEKDDAVQKKLELGITQLKNLVERS